MTDIAQAALDAAREALGPTHARVGDPDFTPATARARLTVVTLALIDAYNTHAENLVAERQAKVSAYQNTDGNATFRDQEATSFSVTEAVKSIRSFWFIRALEEERDHLRFLLTHAE